MYGKLESHVYTVVPLTIQLYQYFIKVYTGMNACMSSVKVYRKRGPRRARGGSRRARQVNGRFSVHWAGRAAWRSNWRVWEWVGGAVGGAGGPVGGGGGVEWWCGGFGVAAAPAGRPVGNGRDGTAGGQ